MIFKVRNLPEKSAYFTFMYEEWKEIKFQNFYG